jgi:hypothetical protein
MLEGPKIGWSPQTQDSWTYARKLRKKQGTRNPRKPVLASKVVNPFTRAISPPFIGRRMDFYIPRLRSNLENIPNVNMYMNVLYILWFAELISYIYKPATISHLKSGLFEMMSLTWPSTDSRGLIHANPRSSRLANLRLPNIPEVR